MSGIGRFKISDQVDGAEISRKRATPDGSNPVDGDSNSDKYLVILYRPLDKLERHIQLAETSHDE